MAYGLYQRSRRGRGRGSDAHKTTEGEDGLLFMLRNQKTVRMPHKNQRPKRRAEMSYLVFLSGFLCGMAAIPLTFRDDKVGKLKARIASLEGRIQRMLESREAGK